MSEEEPAANSRGHLGGQGGIIQRAWRILARIIFAVIVFYLACVVIGLIPVNRGFSQPDEGVTLYVASTGFHCDLILPRTTPHADWSTKLPQAAFKKKIDSDDFSHIAIGWGDRRVYLETPRWVDLKASTVLRTVFVPSETVVHAQFMGKPSESDSCRKLTMSAQQYERLVASIDDSFQARENTVIPIKDRSFGKTDAFFIGRGSYHGFRTCNCWAADALEDAGVTVPWFSPMPGTVLWYLPEKAK